MAKSKLQDFTPQRRNANKHTPRGLSALEKSIQQDGWIGAITVAADGETFDGSARIEVGAATGFEDAVVVETDGSKPVIVKRLDIPSADDPRARRLGLAANRVAQINLDFDIDEIVAAQADGVDVSALWTDAELDALVQAAQGKPEAGEDKGAQVDRAAELAETWGTKLGQVWELGAHRLAVGDCTDKAVVEAVIRGERAALCVTSPPYWVGREYEQEHGAEEIRGHIQAAAACIVAVLDVRSHIAINTGTTTETKQGGGVRRVWLLVDWWAEAFALSEYYLRNLRIWAKHGGFVPFAPAQDVVDLNWEFLASFTPATPRPQNKIGERWALDGVWDCQPQTASVGHSAPFPVEIPSRYIQLYTNEGDVIYEPYCGSGTTLVACEQLGRKGRGVELSPAYAAVTLQRWADMTGQEPRLVT